MIYPIVTIIVLATVFLLHINAAPLHNEDLDEVEQQTDKQMLYERIANLLLLLAAISLIISIII